MKQTSSWKITAILPLALAASSMYAKAAILAPPTAIANSAFPGFGPERLVDGNFATEYASNNLGTNTSLEFTFDGPTTFDRIVIINRGNATTDLSTVITGFRMTYDGVANPTLITRTTIGNQQGGFDALGTQTASIVRLDIDALQSGGTTGFPGGGQVYFLNTPAGMNLVTTTTVTGSSAVFGGGFEASNAVNGLVGFNVGNEFISNAGVNTFLEMDLGSLMMVGGFDFFDRLPTADRVTAFDLTFSVDSIFGNGDDIVQSYTGSTQSAEFAGVNAQYVRYDAVSGGGNLGVSEIQFYAIPEPSSAGLLGLGGLALMTRRRRK